MENKETFDSYEIIDNSNDNAEFMQTLTGERKVSADTPEDHQGFYDPKENEDYQEETDQTDQEQGENIPLSIDKAEMFITLRESAQNLLLNYYVTNKIGFTSKYNYSKEQKEGLVKAWNPILANTNFNVSPWVGVIMAETVANAPLLAMAFEARKANKRIKELEGQIKQMQATEEQHPRKDLKRHWEIDQDFYFTKDLQGNYIKVDERTEKADLSNEYHVRMLTKHGQLDGKTI